MRKVDRTVLRAAGSLDAAYEMIEDVRHEAQLAYMKIANGYRPGQGVRTTITFDRAGLDLSEIEQDCDDCIDLVNIKYGVKRSF